MIRLMIGSVAGGLAQFVVGALFWATPLGNLAFAITDDRTAAVVQAALRGLTPTGAGSYVIPWPDTPAGTVMLGQGPVAMIHFNPAGFPAMDASALAGGLILSIVTMLLTALALRAVEGPAATFAGRARAIALIGLAGVLYFTVSEPVYSFYLPYRYFLYSALAQYVGFVAGGLVLARWFMGSGEQRQEPRR